MNVWDHTMTNRGTYAIRCDGNEVSMLSFVADSVHESTLVREAVAAAARAHGGTVHPRSALREVADL